MPTTAERSSFRAVLHEWARRQLEEKSQHTGPFTVTKVEIEHSGSTQWSDVTFDDEETLMYISFTHDDCTLYGDPCEVTSWSAPDSRTTVTLLNELLAIAEQPE